MDMKAPTSLNLPPHLLHAAFLTGKIPFRACQSDKRVCYTLYIPPSHYLPIHTSLRKSPDTTPKLVPLLIHIHGTRRDASFCRDTLIPFADDHGVAILAPLFPAGLDGPLDLDSYKVLRRESLKADVVLLDILKEVKQIWPGIETGKVAMMGYSGGAQFVHRFAYVWPERVVAVGIAAPGNITLISEDKWPKGTADMGEVFDGRGFNLEDMKRIRHVGVFIGDLDDDKAQVEIRELLGKREGRVVLMRKLWDNWKEMGIEGMFEVVEGVGHEYRCIVPMIEWLGRLQIWDGKRGWMGEGVGLIESVHPLPPG